MDNNNMFNGDQGQQGNQDPNASFQPQYQQPQYQQPQYDYTQGNLEEPMSVGDWMITTLVMLIPCVNIVMMFVWAFSSSEKKSKSNYFKAALIWSLIVLVIYFLIFLIFGASILAATGM